MDPAVVAPVVDQLAVVLGLAKELSALVAVCAVLASRLPPPAPGSTSFYASFMGAVNFFAFNHGKAANAA